MPSGVYKRIKGINYFPNQGFQKGIHPKKEFKKGHIPWNKGRKMTDYPQCGFKKGNPGFHTLENDKSRSEALKGRKPSNWSSLYTPEINQKRRIARLKQKLPTIDTSIELKVKDYLDKNKIKYIHPWNLGNRFQPDFYLPNYNLIVECDGDYWHSRPEVIKRDKQKDAYAKKCGFNILRLSESEINKGQISFHFHNEVKKIK